MARGEFFPDVDQVRYEGPESDNPLAFKHYNPDEMVLGKPMREHLKFAVAYWHSFTNDVADPFGPGCRRMPWREAADPMEAAEQTMHAAFEFFQKLGVDYWCFHDIDVSPMADDLKENNRRLDKIAELAKKKQDETGLKLLWGTASLFVHPRYRAGGGTACSPHVFARAAAQLKKCIEVTHYLGGGGYTFWGGREGYETLLNTDMRRELDNMARLLRMAVDHKRSIGFEGQFFIEPKPKEPTTHQYDTTTATCYAFLQRYGLDHDFKINIEANHATLAQHAFQHELEYALVNGIFGSIDANRGDLLVGWDTDQFPTDLYDTTLCMHKLLRFGGFDRGGLNFDAKLRRQSIDPVDLFHAHIGGMDAFARGLKTAAKMYEDQALQRFVDWRYQQWDDTEIGKKIEANEVGFEDLAKHALEHGEPETDVPSGRQEAIENVINTYL